MKRLLVTLLALVASPALAWAADAPPAASAAGQPTEQAAETSSRPEIKAEGHATPRRGPLVSEFREKLTDEDGAPETVIRLYEDGSGGQVREFVLNGHIFQIEVIPAVGLPYYLVDTTGSGIFDARYSGNVPRLVVPQWVLFRF